MRNDSDPRVAATTDSCRAALGLDSQGGCPYANPHERGRSSPHEQEKIVFGIFTEN